MSTLADYIQGESATNASTPGQVALVHCIHNCVDCNSSLLWMYERFKDADWLYTFCCPIHAPVVRCIYHPEYLLWIRERETRLASQIKLLIDVIDNKERINRGILLLEDVSLELAQRAVYEARLNKLKRYIPERLLPEDVQTLKDELRKAQEALSYYTFITTSCSELLALT